MNTHLKKWLAVLLAISLIMGLAGCGKKEENKVSGIVYVPEYIDLAMDLESISYGCLSGNTLYFQGNRGRDVETKDEYGNAFSEWKWESAICRMNIDGTGYAELENYQLPAIPEGTEGEVYLEAMFPGEDDSIWVHERAYVYEFELPEDFDPVTDYKWTYHTSTTMTYYRRHLDKTGAELACINLTERLGDLAKEGIESTAMDGNGNLYLLTHSFTDISSTTTILVLDSNLNELFRITEEDTWGSLVALGDGSVGMLRWNTDGSQLLTGIDMTAKDWGNDYPISSYVYQIYTGNETYLYLYQVNDTLYGFRKDTQTEEKILSWIDSDINQTYQLFFTTLNNGNVLSVSCDWNNGNKTELAILVPTDAATLPEKQVLTLACLYMDYNLRERILSFNKTHNDIRIQLRTYSEYNTEDDYNAGLTRLLTEIGAGEVPDIIFTGSIPMSRLEGKGILEDLWPYIENDPDIGREGVMENIFKTVERDGKLYRIFRSFYIQTLVGASSVVGDEMGWTLQDLKAALATMPEGCTVLSAYNTKSGMLSTLLPHNMDNFIDWSTGECYFNGEEFKSLLEFCQLFPLEYDWEKEQTEWISEDVLLAEGRQMLMPGGLNAPDTLGYFKALFHTDFTFIGYPTSGDGIGSSFTFYDGLAMASTCENKDAAWEFMRYMLLPEEDENNLYDLHTNRTDFEKLMERWMTPEYETDENGNKVLDENGQPIMIAKNYWWFEGGEMPYYYTTQEEYDQFMALFNATTNVYSYDEAIYNIVTELTEGYFNGDRTVEDTMQQIQNRVRLYVNENR